MKNFNIDQNLAAKNKYIKQKIKLVFGVYTYRADFIVNININKYGYELIKWAIRDVYEQISGVNDSPELVLINDQGEKMSCFNDSGREFFESWEWLAEMLVSYELIGFVE